MVLLPDSPPPAKTRAVSAVSHPYTHIHLQNPVLIQSTLIDHIKHSLRPPRLFSSHLPSSSNLTSLAALIPSSLRFFSMALLRSRAARSSALNVHPIARPGVGTRESYIPKIRLCPTLSSLACSVCVALLKHPSRIEVRERLAPRPLDRDEVVLLALRFAGVYWAAAVTASTSSSHPVVPS